MGKVTASELVMGIADGSLKPIQLKSKFAMAVGLAVPPYSFHNGFMKVDGNEVEGINKL
jgi:hypothetical protein